MVMHKKRKSTSRGAKTSRRSHSKRRGTIESGGRSSDMDMGERGA